MASSLKTTCYRMLIEKKSKKTKPYHIVRYRAEKMHEQFMEKESVATQAQILRCLLVSKKLREAWVIIGYSKEDKRFKVEAKCVRKYIQCNKNDWKIQKRKILLLHVEYYKK